MNAESLVVEQWPIDRLVPYQQNPRRNDDQVERMVAAIEEFGFRIPVVARSDGQVVDGHLRLKAALVMGLKTVPVALADNLTDAQIRAFRLLANQSANWASWDYDLLAAELAALEAEGFDMNAVGFSDEELAEIWAEADSTAADEEAANQAPPVPEIPISRPGDLWLLGSKHRLLCGDSTKAEDVARLLDGVRPTLMVTDPPYGIEYDPEWRAEAGINKNRGKMGKVVNDNRADWTDAWRLFPGDVAYVYHAGLMASVVQQSLERAGFEMRAQIIWAKDRMALSRGSYHWQHEPCWFAVRDGARGHRTNDRSQTTLWEIAARDDGGHGHGTQKPVECMARPIRNHVCKTIYEPFCGSGTTVIAAERLKRACLAIEIDPGYCDVIITRWQQFTGCIATLDGTGRTFGDVTAERQPEAR